jgi:hypothetical protein
MGGGNRLFFDGNIGGFDPIPHRGSVDFERMLIVKELQWLSERFGPFHLCVSEDSHGGSPLTWDIRKHGDDSDPPTELVQEVDRILHEGRGLLICGLHLQIHPAAAKVDIPCKRNAEHMGKALSC